METDKIKEIVNQLTSEFRVFIHKTTEQIISVPDEDYYHEADFEHWDVKFKGLTLIFWGLSKKFLHSE